MNIFKKTKALLRLQEAIRIADKAHKKDGDRYYVMPTTGTSGQLIIMDKKNFRKLKQKKYINRKANVRNLEKECFYHTPYLNKTNAISKEEKENKRKIYLSWVDAIDKIKRDEK